MKSDRDWDLIRKLETERRATLVNAQKSLQDPQKVFFLGLANLKTWVCPKKILGWHKKMPSHPNILATTASSESPPQTLVLLGRTFLLQTTTAKQPEPPPTRNPSLGACRNHRLVHEPKSGHLDTMHIILRYLEGGSRKRVLVTTS